MLIKNKKRAYSRRGAIGVFIAGAYTGTHTPPSGSPAAMGLTEQGYRIRHGFRYQEIGETDVYGETIIDIIYRGGRCEVGGLLHEVLASTFRMFFPFTGTVTPTGTTNQQIGVGGAIGSDLAGAIILTAVATTPAAVAAAPATQTFPKTLPVAGFEFERVYNSKLRQCPFQMMALPHVAGTGNIYFWAAT